MSEPMSVRDYVVQHGLHCPNCSSLETTFEDYPNYQEGVLPCACEACGATWEDVIELRGYKNLKVPDAQP